MSKLLTPIEVLLQLGLYKPGIHTAPNTRYLKILYDQDLLPRVAINSRVFRYEEDKVEELRQKINSGIVKLHF